MSRTDFRPHVIFAESIADENISDPDVTGIRKYFELASFDPRLDSTAIQPVGAKGWDSFSITLVTA
ncbi:hypothetical protein DLM46_10275 [Paraburkholderia lacunae]|uniref:Uncharacterized protein n=1 Tax=Paraburkholderia lacunae TaxID=2211104 RepID=A0A370NAK9_9BURK|nr:hypothetical protein DLM46_10275 [Paraburkholderia lacunae]